MELKYNNIYLKGKEEERKRRTIEVISNCLALDLSLDVTASIANISVEEVKQCIKENHLNQYVFQKGGSTAIMFNLNTKIQGGKKPMQLDYNKIFINTEIEEYSEILSDPFYQGYIDGFIEGFIEGYYQGIEEERERWKIKIQCH